MHMSIFLKNFDSRFYKVVKYVSDIDLQAK